MRCCPHPEERACASASAKSNARARVSKDEDGQDAGPSCFETHRSAAESAQASVFAGAAMLLSMRTECILAKRRYVGETTCGCGSRSPAEMHCFRNVIYNEPASRA